MANFCMLKVFIALCCVYAAYGAPGKNPNPNANPNASNECRGKERYGEDCSASNGADGVCEFDPDFPKAGRMVCKPVACGEPPFLENGYLRDVVVGENGKVQARYNCNTGYFADGNFMFRRSRCRGPDFTWSDLRFSCEPIE